MMLRVTVHDDSGALTFRVEGRLVGPLLHALWDCWETTLADRPRPAIRVDLTAVTFIDAAGKECLAIMHRQGAELIAADCATTGIIAEITRASARG